MDDIKARLLKEFHDKESRTEYADEFLDAAIALQIATLRQERDLTQQELGDLAGMKQSRISTMEKIDYSRWSGRTLRRLAEGFDLPVVFRFEGWGNFLDGVTKLGRRDLDRPPFEKDPVFSPAVAPADSPSSRAGYDATDNVVAFPGGGVLGPTPEAAPASTTTSNWEPPSRTASGER